jgi:hypothetical protein
VLRIAVLALTALVLTGCGALGLRFSYVRADGQDIASNPALYQQFNMDRAICQGEMHRNDRAVTSSAIGSDMSRSSSDDLVQDCMENKGYLVVTEKEAVAQQQELAAKAAEKARLEAEAAAAPPPPPPPPPHRVAKHKPKPKPTTPPAKPTMTSPAPQNPPS